jgi:hypothetical protein
MPGDFAALSRQHRLKTLAEGPNGPPECVIALVEPEDGVAERRDPNDRPVRTGVIAAIP